MTTQFFNRDANHVPITNLGLVESKVITYAAGTTGAIGATTLFTVTGDVAVNVFAICQTNLAGTGTLEVGTASSTACLCDQQTATTIDAHELWHDATIAVGGAVAHIYHVVDENIIQTIASNTVTGGILHYYCVWSPLSADGNVVAA